MADFKSDTFAKRHRTAFARFDPKLLQSMRDLIEKCPNKDLARMGSKGRMTDGDLIDFSIALSCAYFSGALLEQAQAAQVRNLELMMRRTMLVCCASFGATASFESDGAVVISPVGTDDPDKLTAAIQALTDTGMRLKEAMALFTTGPPEKGGETESIRTRLPEVPKEVIH